MKKYTILTILLAVMTLTGYSQAGLGIKAGANFSNIDFEDIDSKSKTGFHFGVFANFPINDVIAIQPEMFFSTIGAKFDNADDIDFSYFSVPILLQANISAINLYVGPQLGIVTNVKSDGIDKDNFKTMDLGMVLGAGVDLPNGFEIGGRYLYAITDISDIDDIGKINNHTWQLYVAWKLFGAE